MKNVILIADNEMKIYSVPDIVADDLDNYCIKFCSEWLRKSPDAKKFRRRGGVYYTEADFNDYLNKYIFPAEKSTLVKCIGRQIPEVYRALPRFNF